MKKNRYQAGNPEKKRIFPVGSNFSGLNYYRCLGLSMCLIMLCASQASASDLMNGLTLYASFDTGASPDIISGTKKATGLYEGVAGIAGNGTRIKEKSNLSYECYVNTGMDKGTVSLWVHGAPSTLQTVYWRIGNHQLCTVPGKLFFMTGSVMPEKGWVWDYSLAIDAPEVKMADGKWHHIVCTWDKTQARRQLFWDGKQAGSGEGGPLLSGVDNSQMSVMLGGGAAEECDELMIWDRVLGNDDVELLFKEPGKFNHELQKNAQKIAASDMKEICPVSVGLYKWKSDGADCVVEPGKPFTIPVILNNHTPTAQTAKVKIEVFDIWGIPCGQAIFFEQIVDARAQMTIPQELRIDKYGAFRVHAMVQCSSSACVCEQDITSFACLPVDPPVSHSFFGSHVSADSIAIARRLGCDSIRGVDMTQYTYWNRMEPEKGQWSSSSIDMYRRYQQGGMKTLGLFFGVPNWASPLPNGILPPRRQGNTDYVPQNKEELCEYVRKAIECFPGIENWEMGNEPWVGSFWKGSPEEYVEFCKTIYTEVKKIRPDVRLFAMIYIEGPWSKVALENGLLKYCDGVSYHLYVSPKNNARFSYEYAVKVKDFIKKFTPNDIPVINSESGISGVTFLRGLDLQDWPPLDKRPQHNDVASCRMAVQSRVGMMAAGIERCYTYLQNILDAKMSPAWIIDNYNTLDITNAPKPSTVAEANLKRQLAGGKFIKYVEILPQMPVFIFKKPDNSYLAITWAEEGAVVKLSGYPGAAIDMMGNKINAAGNAIIAADPVYFQNCATPDMWMSMKFEIIEQPKSTAPVADGEITPKAPEYFALTNELGLNKMIPVSLAAVANMGLLDDKPGDGKGGAMDEGAYNDFRMIQPGKHNWLGVSFLVSEQVGKSVLVMNGKTFPQGPVITSPITVNKKVRGLFLAQAANWANVQGTEIASYIVKYDDGKEISVPIIVGVNINDWWHEKGEKEESRVLPLRHPQSLSAKQTYRFFRVWYWDNPRQNVAISSITVKSESKESTYALLGITAATW